MARREGNLSPRRSGKDQSPRGYTKVGRWCRGVKKLHGGAELDSGVDRDVSAPSLRQTIFLTCEL